MAYTEATRLYTANWRATHVKRYKEISCMDSKKYYAKKSQWRKISKAHLKAHFLARNLF